MTSWFKHSIVWITRVFYTNKQSICDLLQSQRGPQRLPSSHCCCLCGLEDHCSFCVLAFPLWTRANRGNLSRVGRLTCTRPVNHSHLCVLWVRQRSAAQLWLTFLLLFTNLSSKSHLIDYLKILGSYRKLLPFWKHISVYLDFWESGIGKNYWSCH